MYPAKILLFGEYSLMHGSNALAVPFHNYVGKWSKSKSFAESTDILNRFANYLEDNKRNAPFKIDIRHFRKDIETGLYFDSTIPMGYGIGSSGALCAAFYGNYVIDTIKPDCNNNRLKELKDHFSFLESYFHGSSSGIDPLVSYTNSTILLESSGALKRLTDDSLNLDPVSVFLIDTQKKGDTASNISVFNYLLKKNGYSQELKENYNSLVNNCINYYLERNAFDFVSAINQLSGKQKSLFEPMIPSDFLKYFQIAQETAKFSLKLCGSGGGGYLLGFTSDMEYVNRLFSAEGIKVISFDE